jgi:hypothetical protein
MGTEVAAYGLVAQWLNHSRHAWLHSDRSSPVKWKTLRDTEFLFYFTFTEQTENNAILEMHW